MAEIDLAQLVDIVKECAGDSDEFDLSADIIDVPYGELGYDSLALLEIAAKLQQDHGVVIDEEKMETLRRTLDLVNEQLRKEAA